MFHVPNKYRSKTHMASDDSIGNSGFFFIQHPRILNYELRCMASDGNGWDHVSISVAEKGSKAMRCPVWEEMCFIKDLFWDAEDCVIQFHPPRSEYINVHSHVLHLWRPQGKQITTPDKGMI